MYFFITIINITNNIRYTSFFTTFSRHIPLLILLSSYYFLLHSLHFYHYTYITPLLNTSLLLIFSFSQLSHIDYFFTLTFSLHWYFIAIVSFSSFSFFTLIDTPSILVLPLILHYQLFFDTHYCIISFHYYTDDYWPLYFTLFSLSFFFDIFIATLAAFIFITAFDIPWCHSFHINISINITLLNTSLLVTFHCIFILLRRCISLLTIFSLLSFHYFTPHFHWYFAFHWISHWCHIISLRHINGHSSADYFHW